MFQLSPPKSYTFKNCCPPNELISFSGITGILFIGQIFAITAATFTGCATVYSESITGGDSFLSMQQKGSCTEVPCNNCPTQTPTLTPTVTPTPSVTKTQTPSPTLTRTPTKTPTKTPTNTKTPTPSFTQTPTTTPTNTQTPTFTPTPTLTPVTPTPTPTVTPTETNYPFSATTGIFQILTGSNECIVFTVLPMGVTCFSTPPSGPNTSDGSVGLIITGGTQPYTSITWTYEPADVMFGIRPRLPQNQQILNNLPSGYYTAVVSDFYGDFIETITCEVLYIAPTPTPTPTRLLQPPPNFDPFCLNFAQISRSLSIISYSAQFVFYGNFINGYPQYVCTSNNPFNSWTVSYNSTTLKWDLIDPTGGYLVTYDTNGSQANISTTHVGPTPIGSWSSISTIYTVTASLGICQNQTLPATPTPTPTPTVTFGYIQPTPTVTQTVTPTNEVISGTRYLFLKCGSEYEFINQGTPPQIPIIDSTSPGNICNINQDIFSGPCWGIGSNGCVTITPISLSSTYIPSCPEMGPPTTINLGDSGARSFGWKNPNTNQWECWTYLGYASNQSVVNNYLNPFTGEPGYNIISTNNNYFTNNGTITLDKTNIFSPLFSYYTYPNLGETYYSFTFGFPGCRSCNEALIVYENYLNGISPTQLTVNTIIDQPECGCDGSISLTSNGVPPIQYSINNGQTYSLTPIFTNLCPNTYPIKVIDSSTGVYANNVVLLPASNPIPTIQLSINATTQTVSNTLDIQGNPLLIRRLEFTISPVTLVGGQFITLTIKRTKIIREVPTTTTYSSFPFYSENYDLYENNAIIQGSLIATTNSVTTANNFPGCVVTGFPSPLLRLTETKIQTWNIVMTSSNIFNGYVETQVILPINSNNTNPNCAGIRVEDYIEIQSATLVGSTCGANFQINNPSPMVTILGKDPKETISTGGNGT